MTVFPSNNTYHNLRLVNRNIYKPINQEYLLCKDDNCIEKARIYNDSPSALQSITEITESLTIIITDKSLKTNLSHPVFTLSSQSASNLSEESIDSLKISYNYDCHSSDLYPILLINLIASVIWLIILTVWIYNTYFKNIAHAESFHKFCIVILVFKLLNMSSVILMLTMCSRVDIMNLEFLILGVKQTRSLYETFVFFYLLLLSKGWVLVINSMEQKEFNYLMILIIFLYVLDSAMNIVQFATWPLMILMHILALSHIIRFSVNTLSVLNTQLRIIQISAINPLESMNLRKKHMFFAYLSAVFLYFSGEYTLHIYFEIIDFTYRQFALFSALHEVLEVIVIGGLFFLYRARDLGRFFTIDLDRRELPFYESSSFCTEGDLMLIKLPRNKLMIAKSV